MLIDKKQLAITGAIGASVVWVVCSILVALSPGPMTTLTGHMLHMDLGHTGLTMSLTGFVVGLIGWAILAGGFAWLLAALYNFLARSQERSLDRFAAITHNAFRPIADIGNPQDG